MRDLLVSIVLVVVVVSLLVPALTEARERANALTCLSNVGAIARAALAYAADDAQGHFPPSPEWANAGYSMEVYSAENPGMSDEFYFPGGGRIGYNDPWFGMGLLFGEGYITDPQVFYCPDRRGDLFSWPTGWDPNARGGSYPQWRFSSYLYRVFGQPVMHGAPSITTDDILALWHLPAGNAQEALVADVFNLWMNTEPAHLDPFGLNVGFADGHARWMALGDKELARCEQQAASGSSKDVFTWLYFKALSTRDFSPLDAAGYTAEPGNPLDAWIGSCCVLNPTAWTRTSDLYCNYMDWAWKNPSVYRMSRRQFVQALGWLDTVQRERRGRDGFLGIALNPQ